ncbi:DUF6585 family protein [Krasilnikovia sp. MM14-A1259]|uniref:DUF6585 family protein n=1 Tax=Krasilnikovia sp. MM14-A1259 TaxID=3373539 RepID=UPI00399CBBD8
MANAGVAAPELAAAAERAAAGRLGQQTRTHYRAGIATGKFLLLYAGLILGSIVLIAVGLFGGLLIGSSVGVPGALIGALLIGGSITIMLIMPKQRSALVLFEHGFALATPGKVDMVPFADVQELFINVERVWQATQNRYRTDYRYTVHRAGAPELIFDGGYTEVTVLAEGLETGVARAKLGPALEALSAGRELEFGAIRARADGVSCPDGQAIWAQITDVSMKNGCLVIDAAEGGFGWSYEKIANARLLVAIVNLGRRGELRLGG